MWAKITAEVTAAGWWCLICMFSAGNMKGGAMCMNIVIADLQAVRRRIRPRLRRHTLAAAGLGEESGKPYDSLNKNRLGKLMKLSNPMACVASFLTISLWAGAWSVLPDETLKPFMG